MVKTKEYKDLRPIAAKLFKDGKQPREIFENLGRQVALSTVYKWIDEYKKEG